MKSWAATEQNSGFLPRFLSVQPGGRCRDPHVVIEPPALSLMVPAATESSPVAFSRFFLLFVLKKQNIF